MTKDIPIIFSAPMVRALLDCRKTMTRRIIKPQPVPFVVDDKPCDVGLLHVEGDPRPRVTLGRVVTRQQIRFAIGDRLWVRETVACGACAPSKPSTWSPSFWRREQGTPENRNGLWYQADGLSPKSPITERGRWVPSIHMPRWCSRLTLAARAIKIEKLQSITDAEILSEGVMPFQSGPTAMFGIHVEGGYEHAGLTPRETFQNLWCTLHGPSAWNDNPFVVATTFRVIKANIDAPEARCAA